MLLSTTLQTDFEIRAKPVSKNQDSSQFNDASINAYNSTADLIYRLSSPKVHHRQSTGFEFEQPELVYRTLEATTPLYLSAEKGFMGNNSALIGLLGNVNLFRMNPKNDLPEYLYTSNATVDITQRKAYTSDKATFRQYKKITEGVGMVVDLDTQTIRLKSDIKVLNVP